MHGYNVIRAILVFFLSLLLVGCDSCKNSNFPDRFYTITLENKSEDTIKVYLGLDDNKLYPDTSIETNKPAIGFVSIAPGKATWFHSRKKWEEVYDQQLPADTMSIFIFAADTLAYYNWETVRDEYKILQSYDLSRKNLTELNYKITYPPEDMNTVKKYRR